MPNTNTQQLISMIFATIRLVRERSENREKIDPTSVLQIETLRYVSIRKNPTMHEVAEHLCVKPPSATSLIDNLVHAKKLSRIVDKDDRRIVRLIITLFGKKTMEDGFKKITKRMESILVKLNEKERRDLLKILHKLSDTY